MDVARRPRFSLKSMLWLTTLVAIVLYLLLYHKYEMPIKVATSPNRIRFASDELAQQAATLQFEFSPAPNITAEFEALQIDPRAKTGEDVVLAILRVSTTTLRTLPEALRHYDLRLPLTDAKFVGALEQALDVHLAAPGSCVLELRGLEFAE